MARPTPSSPLFPCVFLSCTLECAVMEYEEKPKSPVGEGVTEQVMVALRRIIRAIDLRSRFLVARYHLTVPQLVVLKELWLRGNVSVGELTRAVHLSHATVTGILDRLEKRGLVQRQRSDRDKRRVQVRLTPSGERVQLLAHRLCFRRTSPRSLTNSRTGNERRSYPRSNAWCQ